MKRINISLLSLMLLVTLFTVFSCSKSSLSYTQDGDWVTRAYFGGKARGEAVSFTKGDYAYIATGYDPQNPNIRLTDTWKFDPSGPAGTWRNQEADYPVGASQSTGRSQAVAFVLSNGLAYVGSGYDGYTSLSDFFSYDPIANVWTAIAPLADNIKAYPRYDAVAFGIQDTGYVTTGSFDQSNNLNDTWSYYPGTNTWKQTVSFIGEPRTQAVAFVYKNKGYVVTGVDNNTELYTFFQFDPSQADSAKWYRLRDIANTSTDTYDDGYVNIVRQNAVAFVMLGVRDGDIAYMTTGKNGSLYTTTWEYYFATDLWKEKTPLEAGAREAAVGFTVKNRGYVATGLAGATAYSDLYEWHPDSVQITGN